MKLYTEFPAFWLYYERQSFLHGHEVLDTYVITVQYSYK